MKEISPRTVRTVVLTASIKAHEETKILLPPNQYINRVVAIFASDCVLESVLVSNGMKLGSYDRPLALRSPYDQAVSIGNDLSIGGRLRDYTAQYLSLYRMVIGIKPYLLVKATADMRLLFEIWRIGDQ